MSIDLNNSKSLDLNLYEIRIDFNFIKNKNIINTLLYQCKCCLFLIDILNFNSIILIENLLETIKKDKNNFPYLKTIYNSK